MHEINSRLDTGEERIIKLENITAAFAQNVSQRQLRDVDNNIERIQNKYK